MAKRVAILISGRGDNMQALCHYAQNDNSHYKITRIIAKRTCAPGLQWAIEMGYAAILIDRKYFGDQEDFDEALDLALSSVRIDITCLSGFMHKLSPWFVDKWRGRLINSHSSLLPAFSGSTPQKRALEERIYVSGCTIHFINEGIKTGPIIHSSGYTSIAKRYS